MGWGHKPFSPFFIWRFIITIQHRLIPDAELHEPKGVASAANHTAYVAGGSGTGTWKRIDSTDLLGLAGDGGSTNKYARTNGANGFVLKTDNAFGNMAITNNTNAFALTAAVDATLQTNTDYVLFSGTGAPWAGETMFGGMSFTTDRITVPVTGTYEIQLWANITTYPSNTAFVGAQYRVNGTTFGPRKVITKSNSAGDSGQLNGFGFTALNAGDYVQLYVASSVTGGLIIKNANTVMKLLKET